MFVRVRVMENVGHSHSCRCFYCGPRYSHYLSVHRTTQGRDRAPVVVPPPEGSHGIGDWELQALRLARGAIKDGAPLFVDWPDAFASREEDQQELEDKERENGALAPVTSAMEVSSIL